MADAAPAANPQDERRQQQCAQKWIAEITASEKAQRTWLESRARKIVKRYRYDDSQTRKDRKYAMLWSNIQTVLPATYAQPPQAVVTRRFNDQDPVARAASEILERCLNYSIDVHDIDGVEKQATLDYVLVGRGQSWERYVPTFGPEITPPPIPLQVKGEDDSYADDEGNAYSAEQVQEGEDGAYFHQPEAYRPVTFEESITDYVNWEDFGHSVSRTWDEVGFVWRRVYMSRKQLTDRFGKLGELIPLDWGPIEQGGRDEAARMQKKAAVYEVWDKATRKVYWISKSWSSRPLDERDDPLGLPGFFPCPRPLLGTTANDSCLPTPDYVYYQDQAEEIDVLTARIKQLQDALKVKGFYAADAKTNLNALLNSDNNVMIPVPDWLTFKDGGGLAGKIEWWPIAQVVTALKACVEQRQLLVNDVWQISGVSDIMRGMSDPNATATAERLKGHWGPLRVREKQKEVQRFAKDQLRIKGGVIAAKFDPTTLKAMSGVKLPTAAEKQALQQQLEQQAAQAQMQAQAMQQGLPIQAPPMPGAPMMGHNGGPPMAPQPTEEQQATLRSPTWEDVVALLRDNAHRQFRVDIETDSTIEADQAEEKQQAVELATALGVFIQQWGPAIQQQPALAPLAAGVLKFTIRRFRAGRELEDLIESTMDKVMNAPAQAQPAALPDRSLEVAQVKGQADIQRETIKQQGEDGRAQLQAQIDRGDQALEATAQQLKLVIGGRDPEPQATV